MNIGEKKKKQIGEKQEKKISIVVHIDAISTPPPTLCVD